MASDINATELLSTLFLGHGPLRDAYRALFERVNNGTATTSDIIAANALSNHWDNLVTSKEKPCQEIVLLLNKVLED